jgi:pyruvate dehydrogenase E2 component (dihydrolipoamide acetyltransferase)
VAEGRLRKFGPFEAKPLSRIKKISGANLHRNWVMIPHVTNNDEADITELEALRVQLNKEHEKAGVKFTMLAFVIKAVVAALKKFPTFNASLDGDNLVFKQYFHIGFAADTPNGLVVPVIRDADKKGLVDREGNGRAVEGRARRQAQARPDAGRLLLDLVARRHRRHALHADHQRAGSGDPRVVARADEAGVGRQAVRAAPDAAAFLSYDHRVIDGAEAARFNAYLGALLADFRRIIL